MNHLFLGILLTVAVATGALGSRIFAAPVQKDFYSNDNLHAWACDIVIESDPSKGGGCYDICNDLAVKAKIEGNTFYEPDMSQRLVYWGVNKRQAHYETTEKIQPQFLTNEHPEDLINACAIVLIGAEW